MTKKLISVLTGALLCLLTACSPSSEIQQPDSSSEKTTDTAEIFSSEDISSEEYKFDPAVFDQVDLTQAARQEGDTLTGKFYYFDYGYAGLLDFPCYNSVGNPELFDELNYEYNGENNSMKLKYFKVMPGDTVAGLTCTAASSIYITHSPDYTPGDKTYLQESRVQFDGEITVSGYLYKCKDEAYRIEGDVLFIPDESWNGLPIAYRSQFNTYEFEGLLVNTPFTIELGDAEKNSGFDIFEDGSRLQRASVTLENLYIMYSDISYSRTLADIVEVEKI